MFLIVEILLSVQEIAIAHREPEIVPEVGQLAWGEGCESFENRDIARAFDWRREGGGGFERGLVGIDRVDEVVLHHLDLLGQEFTSQKVDLRRSHWGRFFPCQDGNALCGRIGPLIELTGQEFHCKNMRTSGLQSLADGLGERVGKNERAGLLKHLRRDMIDEVALQNTQAGEFRKRECFLQVG